MFQFRKRFHYGSKKTYDFNPMADVRTGIPAEDLERFVGEPTPRYVPASYLKSLYAATVGGQWSGFLVFLCALFVCVFGVAALVMFPWNAPAALLMSLGWRESVRGEAVSYVMTSARIRYNNGPWQHIYKVNLRFTPAAGGREVSTFCYVTGQSALPDGLPNADGTAHAGAGVPMTIRYFPPAPGCAVIPGGSTDSSYIFPAIFGFFALAALAPLLVFFVKKRRFRKILAEGEPALAAIETIEETSLTINNQRVHAVHLFMESDLGGEYGVVKARGPRLDFFRGCLAENRKLKVLYLPDSPNRVALLGIEELPGDGSGSAAAR